MNAPLPARTTVLLADDHPLLLKGLRDIVSAEADFVVIGTALDGEGALELIRSLRPQLVVLDLAMPKLSGLDVLKVVAREVPLTRTILLTAMINDHQILEALASGINGILLKESAPEALVDCLRTVAAGQCHLPDGMTERALSRRSAATDRQRMIDDVLTSREREVAALVCEGRPNHEVAGLLGLSPGTVRIHLHNIYGKLNVRNRTALAAAVLQQRLS